MTLDDYRYCKLKKCPNPNLIDAYADLTHNLSDEESIEVKRQIEWCNDCQKYYNEKWIPIFKTFVENRHNKYWSTQAFMTFFEIPVGEFEKLTATNRISLFDIDGKEVVDMDSIYLHGKYHGRFCG